MFESFNSFLKAIKSTNIENAYSLLLEDFQDAGDKKIADELKLIFTSHFIRQRQNKFNGLINLKKSGFLPDVVIDVGAQIGTPELYNAFPDAHHVFIEPVSECLDSLNKICNNLKSAEVINCAISNYNGKASISINDTKQYSSIDTILSSDIREIKVKTIDTICEDLKISGQILLKIDVDGPEVKVLQGSKSLLNAGCIIVIEASIADQSPRFGQIIDYLSPYGYEIYDIVDPLYRQSDWHLWQVDIILIKKNSPFWGSKTYI